MIVRYRNERGQADEPFLDTWKGKEMLPEDWDRAVGLNLRLEVKSENRLNIELVGSEPGFGDFVRELRFALLAAPLCEDDYPEDEAFKQIGECICHVVLGNHAYSFSESPYEQSDATGGDLEAAASLFFRAGGPSDHCMNQSLVLVQRLFIEPELRRKGLGKQLLLRSLQYCDGFGVAVVYTSPNAGHGCSDNSGFTDEELISFLKHVGMRPDRDDHSHFVRFIDDPFLQDHDEWGNPR